jgi:hypothetical protein
MSSRLTALEILFVWSTDGQAFPSNGDLLRLAEELDLKAPKLNHLTFRNFITRCRADSLERAGVMLAGLVQAQPTLQRLDIDISLWAYFTSESHPMTNLVELRLQGTQIVTGPKPKNILSLPSLREIEVDLWSNIKDTWDCLLSSAGSTIEDIKVDADIDVRDVVELFGVIGLYCTSLRSLELTNAGKGDRTLFMDLLLSLHPCAELAHLRIQGMLSHDISLSLHDEDMRAMALAWPKLEVLSLGPTDSLVSFGSPAPTLSLCSLHHLCVHCPRLRSVRLTLKTAPIPIIPPRLSRFNSVH